MNVKLSARARAEYDSALAFLSEGNGRATEDLRVRIEAAFESLKALPNRGRPGAFARTREMPVRKTPYVIVYTIDVDGVLVLRIRHTSQDPAP